MFWVRVVSIAENLFRHDALHACIEVGERGRGEGLESIPCLMLPDVVDYT